LLGKGGNARGKDKKEEKEGLGRRGEAGPLVNAKEKTFNKVGKEKRERDREYCKGGGA